MITTYRVAGPATYAGRCVVCLRESRQFESTLLRGPGGEWACAHDRCAGQRRRNRVSGGAVLTGPATLTVDDERGVAS